MNMDPSHRLLTQQDASLQRCAAVPDRHSRVLGGIPGFYVFENLWFNNGTFCTSLSLTSVERARLGNHGCSMADP